MFFINKLKKWIKLEIEELEDLKGKYIIRNDTERIIVCKEQIRALHNVLYIINNKGVWINNRGHGIFKSNNKRRS